MNAEAKLPLVESKLLSVLTLMKKNIQRISGLQDEASEIKENYAEICKKQKELLDVQEELKKQLQNVMEEQEIFTKAEHKWQQKLETVDMRIEQDITADLANQYCLLGYTFTDCQVRADGSTRMTLHYNEYCYIQFGARENCFELLQMCPEHPRIAEIKVFLQHTQDILGLLANVRKFFKLAMSLKTTCQ